MYSKHYWREEASEPWAFYGADWLIHYVATRTPSPLTQTQKKPKTAKPIPNSSHPTIPPVGASLLAIAPANPPPILKLPSKPTHTPRPNNARKPTAIPCGSGLARDSASPTTINAEDAPKTHSNACCVETSYIQMPKQNRKHLILFFDDG
jgi:hypothetical protein